MIELEDKISNLLFQQGNLLIGPINKISDKILFVLIWYSAMVPGLRLPQVVFGIEHWHGFTC